MHEPVPNPDDVSAILWSKDFWWVYLLMGLGALARVLAGADPINYRRFAGEVVFAFIGAVVIFTTGLLQGMPPLQIILLGALSSLGGIRAVEWVIKLAQAVASKGGPK